MEVTISKHKTGCIGLVGHVGVGHVHSHLGFVQDDSGGLAVVASLLQKALPVDTTVHRVNCDLKQNCITVTTRGGGTGAASPRRGISPAEAELMQAAVGQDAIFTQSLAVRTFGRLYGQGIWETPVAFQSALALSVIDTFVRNYPHHCLIVDEDIPGNHGRILGAVVDITGIPVSMLAVVNATAGGIGPNEDLEGNIMSGAKGELMERLSLDSIPTIVVEGKAYVPSVCATLTDLTFWIRAQENVDNTTIARKLLAAATRQKIPAGLSLDALPQEKGALRQATYNLGQRIANLGQCLARAEKAADKVAIVAKLATLISQDAGGVTFMSDAQHEVVRGAGLLPGTGAVLSLLVPPSYIDWWKIPLLTAADVNNYLRIITVAISQMKDQVGKPSV
jgi:hypothetical protein